MPKTRISKKPRDEEDENITAKKPRLLSERSVNTVVISTSVPDDDDDLKPAAVPINPGTLPPVLVVNATPVKRMASHLRDLPVQIRLSIYECLRKGTYGYYERNESPNFPYHFYGFYSLTHESYLRMWAMASTFGDLEALQYIQEVFLRDQPELWPKMCCESGHFPDLLYNSHVRCLKFVRSLGTPWPMPDRHDWRSQENLFAVAIQGNATIETLQYLRSDGCPFDSLTLASAIKRGDSQIIRWLLICKCPRTFRAFNAAVEMDDIVLLKRIYNRSTCTWGKDTMDLVLRNENCEIISWIIDELEYPLKKKDFRCAAEHGNIEIMKFLRERACPWDESTFTAAVKRHGNNMNLLQWLHTEQCPWNSETFAVAVRYNDGNLSLLEWLNSYGCPWDKYAWDAAEHWENKATIMEWLYRQVIIAEREEREEREEMIAQREEAFLMLNQSLTELMCCFTTILCQSFR